MIESLYILIITAAACSILGVFLVLRRLSMVSDAISHSVLLGIVIGFFITKDLRSVWLIVAAALFGVFTTMAIEVLIKSRRVGEDAAVGIIFPLFFSIAVILITRFARNVHLDTDMVLMGEVIVAPFNRTTVLGISLPKALIIDRIIACTEYCHKFKIGAAVNYFRRYRGFIYNHYIGISNSFCYKRRICVRGPVINYQLSQTLQPFPA